MKYVYVYKNNVLDQLFCRIHFPQYILFENHQDVKEWFTDKRKVTHRKY